MNNLMQIALFHWAKIACMHDAICKHKYYSLKARGKTHGQALLYVGDRLAQGALYDVGEQHFVRCWRTTLCTNRNYLRLTLLPETIRSHRQTL